MIRFCEHCNSEEEFSKWKIQPWCDACSDDWLWLHLRSNHLLSEHKKTVLESQGGECRLCGKNIDDRRSLEHQTLDVLYGVVCGPCIGTLRYLGSLEKAKEFEYDLGVYHSIQENITSKDRRWLALCVDNAKRFSTCAKAQHFSIIINTKGRLVGEGWNGVPAGEVHCSMGGCARAANQTTSNSSYKDCLAQHAEVNAIMHADRDELEGATIYISGTPCYECVRTIVHSGIKRVAFVWQDQYDPVYALATLGKHDISVPVQDENGHEAKLEFHERWMRTKYKVHFTTDMDYVKNVVSYLQFNQMMDNVRA